MVFVPLESGTEPLNDVLLKTLRLIAMQIIMEGISVVKIPAFVPSNPTLWFKMVESAFELAVPKPITDERTKYNYCVSHLSPDVAVAVQHQLPPNVRSILVSIEPNTAQKDAEVAERILVVTPVQVCAFLKSSSVNSDVSGETELLKELKHLRQQVKELPQSKSYSRNCSNPRTKSLKMTPSNLCWYHKQIVSEARKCVQSCSFQENMIRQKKW
ncbi:hypothetical protein AVEN_182461-1 [Araneus ventricosus]|uniref:DUF7041 domain-containing protein n=1 Tax=Araneus ventricosus TaxID=182803 RepID=A0A4Y2K1N3_ARAVE|nr:hypothetical protein AVEN_182461-1 [Araneus ventricosus]